MFEPHRDWLVPAWPAPASVRAAVATRTGPARPVDSPYGFNLGTRCGDDPLAVARNRTFLSDALRLPAAPCWLHQVHGTRVIAFGGTHPGPATLAGGKTAACEPPLAVRAGSNAGGGVPAAGLPGERTMRGPGNGARGADGGHVANEPASEPEADAAVTRTPGVVLAIQTADCLPVLFCADDGSEVAAAHAGWRGLCAGVLENTLAAMHAPRANIMAWLGPAIAAPSYEVGDEVRAAFTAHDGAAAAAFTATRAGHWLCDLYALARQRLHAAGVMRVSGGGLDTFTNARLHSFRRDGARSGRMASLIWMSPQDSRGAPVAGTTPAG